MTKRQTGFSLIELMVVVAIAAVLASLAAPSFKALIKNNRLASDTNDLIGDLALARSESSKRGMRVSICSSANGTSCLANGAANWTKGRIIFVDLSTAGTIDNGDQIIRVTPQLRTSDTLAATGFANASFIQYRPKGNTDSTGTFKLCDDRSGSYGRTISINTLGRASLTSSTATCP